MTQHFWLKIQNNVVPMKIHSGYHSILSLYISKYKMHSIVSRLPFVCSFLTQQKILISIDYMGIYYYYVLYRISFAGTFTCVYIKFNVMGSIYMNSK